MTVRWLAALACVLLVVASCAYPEFGFTPDDAGETIDVAAEVIADTGTARTDDASVDDTEPPPPVDSSVDAAADTIAPDGLPADTRDAADSPGTFVTLLGRGVTWRYLDDGSTPSSTWRGGGGFDDSKWKSGLAQLGFGDGDEKTIISGGVPDSGVRYATHYFRRFITVSDAASFDTVMIRLLRDDGAIVYFNGREVARSNLPSGTVSNSTLATSTVNSPEEDFYYGYSVPAATLAEGSNVIAVEIHQASLTSSDASFDLELVGHKP